MPSWLCSIWKFIANIVGKVVDLVLDIVKKIVAMVVEAIDAIGDSLLSGSFLAWLAVGFVVYLVLTREKDDEPVATYSFEERNREELTNGN